MSTAGDFIFNCQMGRGRTTTGMVSASLISSILSWNKEDGHAIVDDESVTESYDAMDGPSEEEAYLQGDEGSRLIHVLLSNLV